MVKLCCCGVWHCCGLTVGARTFGEGEYMCPAVLCHPWQLHDFWKMYCHPCVLLSILIPSEMRKLLYRFGLVAKHLGVLRHLSTACVAMRRITYLNMSAKISL